jgi:hypothetical protein
MIPRAYIDPAMCAVCLLSLYIRMNPLSIQERYVGGNDCGLSIQARRNNGMVQASFD